jgi:hypothetical protein
MVKKIVVGVVSIACLSILTAWRHMPLAAGSKSLSSLAPGGRTLLAQTDFGKLPVSFIPNGGQWDESVDYAVQGRDKTVWFGAGGVTLALNQGAEGQGWVVKLDFVGADPNLRPVGLEETGTVFSYFKGRPGNWKTGLAACSRLVYVNLWPGIDLSFAGTMDKLKYEFIVRPGADPSRIVLSCRGASSVLINDQGGLVVSTPSGSFEDGRPLAYQERAGKRTDVGLGYRILNRRPARSQGGDLGNAAGEDVLYGFSVGAYDRTRPLVLDPVILVYCGYLGGPGHDYGNGLAADGSGHVYLAGTTYSGGTAFPTEVGPDQTFNGGSLDAFVAKLNPSGTALEYCGYIGGAGDDYASGLAVDSSGNAYVTGYTSSTEATFPVRRGPDLIHHGLFDAFVAKVKADGTALDYCGYIGGSSRDYGRGIAVDSFGYAYIVGSTFSSAATFPVKAGPTLTYGGQQDAFVAAVNAAGTELVYCGYIGGAGDDSGSGIAVDLSGNAYLTGSTTSKEDTFPVIFGPDLTYNGNSDAFVAEVDYKGEFFYCGYIGGSGKDYGNAIAVDLSGNAYITGLTSSTESTFPVRSGPDTTFNGEYDAFLVKVNELGSVVLQGGYIGGAGYEAGTGVAVDRWGFAYVTGYTSSREDTFPVKEGPDLTAHGSFDVFVAKVSVSGMDLAYAGYLGGVESDLGRCIALDADGSGNVYLAGSTLSTEATFPVAVGPGLVANGGRDAFLAKVYENSITLTSPNGGEGWPVGFVRNITWLTSGQVGNVRIEYSTDNGETWSEVTASTENDGSYAWLVPYEVSSECLVRISEADDGSPSDTSNAVFTIHDDPIYQVTSPNGGESWPVGSTQTITWLSGGDVGDLKIEYSTDSGLTWIEIIDVTENDGVYTWIVPDTESSECLVRISEADDGIPSDISDGLFSIVAATFGRAAKSK